MSDVTTKNDLLVLEKNIDKKLSTLEVNIDKRINKAVDDLSYIITEFASQVDRRFSKIEADVDDLRTSLNHLVNTVDGFVKNTERSGSRTCCSRY